VSSVRREIDVRSIYRADARGRVAPLVADVLDDVPDGPTAVPRAGGATRR
jgi:hypothetical protein